MDSRLYKVRTFDCGIVEDETIKVNPRVAKVTKISGNEVLWEFDNCEITVTAEGSGNVREKFKVEVKEL